MKILPDLFLTFAKIGMFTFGGGYAMIAFIEDACVVKKRWITHGEMMDIAVIAESTPGPIAINCATYVGFRQKGLPGAVAATLGIVLPSFAVIYFLSVLAEGVPEFPWIAHALMGIRAAVGILIVDAALKMIRKMQRKPLLLAIAACAAASMLVIDICALRISSIALMLLAAAVSVPLFSCGQGGGKEAGET